MTTKEVLKTRSDREMTETEAAKYAQDRYGFNLTVSRLQQSRIGKCSGPKYIKKDGFHVYYTRRFIDEYVNANKPRIIDPAKRFARMAI